MVELYMTKTLTGFEVDKCSYGDFSKLKLGAGFKAKVTKPGKRVLAFHKKFFALLAVAYEHRPERLDEMNKEIFRKEVVSRTGYYNLHVNFKGRQIYEAKSISFAKMSKDDFEDMYKKAVGVIIEYVLEGSRTEEIEKAVLEKLNGF